MTKDVKDALTQFGKAIATTIFSVGLSLLVKRYVKIPTPGSMKW